MSPHVVGLYPGSYASWRPRSGEQVANRPGRPLERQGKAGVVERT